MVREATLFDSLLDQKENQPHQNGGRPSESPMFRLSINQEQLDGKEAIQNFEQDASCRLGFIKCCFTNRTWLKWKPYLVEFTKISGAFFLSFAAMIIATNGAASWGGGLGWQILLGGCSFLVNFPLNYIFDIITAFNNFRIMWHRELWNRLGLGNKSKITMISLILAAVFICALSQGGMTADGYLSFDHSGNEYGQKIFLILAILATAFQRACGAAGVFANFSFEWIRWDHTWKEWLDIAISSLNFIGSMFILVNLYVQKSYYGLQLLFPWMGVCEIDQDKYCNASLTTYYSFFPFASVNLLFFNWAVRSAGTRIITFFDYFWNGLPEKKNWSTGEAYLWRTFFVLMTLALIGASGFSAVGLAVAFYKTREKNPSGILKFSLGPISQWLGGLFFGFLNFMPTTKFLLDKCGYVEPKTEPSAVEGLELKGLQAPQYTANVNNSSGFFWRACSVASSGVRSAASSVSSVASSGAYSVYSAFTSCRQRPVNNDDIGVPLIGPAAVAV